MCVRVRAYCCCSVFSCLLLWLISSYQRRRRRCTFIHLSQPAGAAGTTAFPPSSHTTPQPPDDQERWPLERITAIVQAVRRSRFAGDRRNRVQCDPNGQSYVVTEYIVLIIRQTPCTHIGFVPVPVYSSCPVIIDSGYSPSVLKTISSQKKIRHQCEMRFDIAPIRCRVRSPSDCHIRTHQFDVLFSDISSSPSQNVYDTRFLEILVLLPDLTRIEFLVRGRRHSEIGAVAWNDKIRNQIIKLYLKRDRLGSVKQCKTPTQIDRSRHTL